MFGFCILVLIFGCIVKKQGNDRQNGQEFLSFVVKHYRAENYGQGGKHMDVMNREVNHFKEFGKERDLRSIERIEPNRQSLKEIYAQLEVKLETEAFRYERMLELAQQEQDADSMGGTLITPINPKDLGDSHERK